MIKSFFDEDIHTFVFLLINMANHHRRELLQEICIAKLNYSMGEKLVYPFSSKLIFGTGSSLCSFFFFLGNPLSVVHEMDCSIHPVLVLFGSFPGSLSLSESFSLKISSRTLTIPKIKLIEYRSAVDVVSKSIFNSFTSY